MDPVLEAKFLDNLFEYRAGCTTVLISHRPNLVLQCDWVIYLEDGNVKYPGRPADMKQKDTLSQFVLQS